MIWQLLADSLAIFINEILAILCRKTGDRINDLSKVPEVLLGDILFF